MRLSGKSTQALEHAPASPQDRTMKRVIIIAALLVVSVAHAQNYRNVWDDVRRPWRANSEMDAAVQADSRACDAEVGELRGVAPPQYKQCMLRHDWKFNRATKIPAARPSSSTIIYNRDSPDPGIGWHWEHGMRTCHYDCDNPRIPGSGYTCKDIDYMGRPTTECTKKNE
jgi:hypothetical protein